MQYRIMPKNGDKLSALGYGCMRFPVVQGKIDEAVAAAQLRGAIDAGINYLDTAWPYHAGESERFLGKALQEGYRERVKLATKLPSWMIQSREDMDRYLNRQLEKLATDRIDYYLLHALTGASWEILLGFGVFDFLEKAKADGRIVNAGFSFHGLAEDFIRIVDAYPWEFCQIQYNYLDEAYQAGTAGMRYAASKGMGIIVMEPLRGGSLGHSTPPPPVQAIWDRAPMRRTPAEWAFRWVWNHPEVTVVLSGMNETAQITENLAIADKALPESLSAEELACIEEAADAYRVLMQVGCTGCGYCMPCPAEVMIPICFEEYNQMHMFGSGEQGKFRYALRMSGELADGRPGYASQCVQCRECVEKCPQQIPIPDMLRKIVAEMEDASMPDRLAMAKKIFKITA